MASDPLAKTAWLIALVFLVTLLLPRVLGRRRIGLIAPAIGVLGIAFQLLVNRGEGLGQVGFTLSAPALYLQSFLAMSGILLVVLGVGSLTGRLRLRPGMGGGHYLRLSVNILLHVVQNAAVAVFTEELVFRGLVQRGLSQALAPVPALLIASAAFGIWHAPLGQLALALKGRQRVLYPLGTGLAGAVMGLFYTTSGSLWVSGFAHGVWNGLVYPIWGLSDAFPSLLVSEEEAWTHPEYGVAGVLVLALAVPALLILFL
jgi:membrane protease YdiL (CAAX protease family)